MIIGLFPMTVLAADAEMPAADIEAPAVDTEIPAADEAEVYSESPYTPGPRGDEDVAVMVYGKSIADAVYKADYGFMDFVNALKAELQGWLANEKLPEVELYLVNDKGQEYKLTPNAVEDAAFLSSFHFDAGGILGWLDYVVDFIQVAFGWLISGIDTIGEFYKIYGATDVPEGDYTLQVREIRGEGYTLHQPETGSCRVHVGDGHVNYVGYEQVLGDYTFNISVDLWLFEIDVDVLSISFSMPGVFLDAEEPGFTFKSADMGGNGLPGTEFVLVNRDETEKIVKAAIALGKDTFTNAMNLVGTEGFTWEELSILNKELLLWDSEAQQITFNDAQAYKLVETYWALAEASALMPITDFLSDDTDIRLPAILCAVSDENGYVHFTEDSNVTLIWSLQVLLDMGNIVLSKVDESDFTEGMFDNPVTEAIVNFVIELAAGAAEQGVEFWDENGELIDGVINDWVYPVLQNDNVMQAAKDAVIWFVEDDMTDEMEKIISLMPTHALLTPKMPAGHYIMMETDVPDGYFRNPLFYTIELIWNTESQNTADWCYATVGNLGIIAPYYAEEYYDYLRDFDLAAAADDVLNYITGGRVGTLLEDTLSGSLDVTAESISFFTNVIYNYMGGSLVYSSQEELAQALTDYLYAYGRTAQNMLMFANKIVKEAKGVITDNIDENWTFYNISTSRRTNIALHVKALLQGIADSIVTDGSDLNTAAQDTINGIADSIDTSNRILEETTEIINAIEETVEEIVEEIVNTVIDTVLNIAKGFIIWWGKRP